MTETMVLHSPDPSRVSSRPTSLTASPTVELLEIKAERLSLGAVQTDLQTEIKKIWDEEKKRDEIIDTLRDSMWTRYAAPYDTPTPTNENGPGNVWGMGEEIRKIWADERRRSQMSTPKMRYSPVVSPILDKRKPLRTVSSKGSLVASLKSEESGFSPVLTRTASSNRSVTSPLVPQEEKSSPRQSTDGLVDKETSQSGQVPISTPPAATGGLYITNPSASPRSDFDEAEMFTRNLKRDTITIPKRMNSGLGIISPVNPYRSVSMASQNTLQRAGSIFKDFDGVYRSASLNSNATSVANDFVDELDRGLGLSSPLVPEAPPAPEPEPVKTPVYRCETGYSDSIPPRHSDSPRFAPPKPPMADGMVYYPAPVPRVLNLPKKLSKRPAANSPHQRPQQEPQRQSMFFDVRKSAMYGYGPPHGQTHYTQVRANGVRTPDSTTSGRLSVLDSDRMSNKSSPERRNTPGRLSPSKNNRQTSSAINTQGEPAPGGVVLTGVSGHDSVPHEVKVKKQSAVLTLESLLNESARAPIAGRGSSPVHTRTRSASPEKPASKSKVNYLSLGRINNDSTLQPQTSTVGNTDPEKDHHRSDSNDAWTSKILTSFDRFSVIEEDENDATPISSPTLHQPVISLPMVPHALKTKLSMRELAQGSGIHMGGVNGVRKPTLPNLEFLAKLDVENKTKTSLISATTTDLSAGSPGKLSCDAPQNWPVTTSSSTTNQEDVDPPLALLPVPPPKSPKRKLINFRSAMPAPTTTTTTAIAPATTAVEIVSCYEREDTEALSVQRSRLFGTDSPLEKTSNPSTGKTKTGLRPNPTARAVSAAPSFHSTHNNTTTPSSSSPLSDKENETTPASTSPPTNPHKAPTSTTTPAINQEQANLTQRTKRLQELKQLSNYLANGKSSLKRGNTVRAVSAYTQGSLKSRGVSQMVGAGEEGGGDEGGGDHVEKERERRERSGGEGGEEEEEDKLAQKRARPTGLRTRTAPTTGNAPQATTLSSPTSKVLNTIRPIQPSFYHDSRVIFQGVSVNGFVG